MIDSEYIVVFEVFGIEAVFERLQKNLCLIDLLIWIVSPFFLLSNLRDAVGQSYHWLLLTNEMNNFGDWLINYQGGFVRRGLPGEFLLYAHKLTGLELEKILFVVTMFLLFSYFGFAILSLLKKRSLAPYVLILFAPFLFRFHQFNHIMAFRKEIIALALISCFTWFSLSTGKTCLRRILCIVLALYPLIVFSHEMLIFVLPYFIMIYGLRSPLERKEIILFASISILSLLAFLFSLRYGGTVEQVQAICDSLAPYSDPERLSECLTNTPISFLGNSAQDGRSWVMERINNSNYFPIYFNVLWMSAIAYIPLYKKLNVVFSDKMILGLLFVSIIATIIVCYVAYDWGRFIYINLSSIFFVALTVKSQEIMPTESLSTVFKQKLRVVIAQKRDVKDYVLILVILIGTFLYSKFWFIPGCCYSDSEYFPLAPFGKDIVTFFSQLVS